MLSATEIPTAYPRAARGGVRGGAKGPVCPSSLRLDFYVFLRCIEGLTSTTFKCHVV